MAMTKVAEVVVGSGGSASIEFTNIPQTGKDLLIFLSIRKDSSPAIYTYFNSLAVENCPYIRLYGNGCTASSSNPAPDPYLFSGIATDSNDTANTFSNQNIYISNYTSSANKSVSIDSVNEHNATEAFQDLVAGVWEGTNAISSLKFQSASGTIQQYSTASLYIIS